MSGIAATRPVPARRSGMDVTTVLRRGLDSTIANWQVFLMRIVEAMLIMALMVATVIAVVVPLAISIGVSLSGLGDTIRSSDTPGEVLASLIAGHWLILVYILVAISFALLVAIVVHSFVMGASARTFVDAERAAGDTAAPRQRFAVFTFDRWLAGGRQTWWPVFWIYNIAYGVAAIAILVPLLPFALLIVLFQNPKAALALGCLAFLVVLFVSIAVLVVTNIVCQRAIVAAAESPIDGMTSLRRAWRAMKSDFGRHFAVAFIMMVLLFGGTGFITMASFGFAVPTMNHSYASLMFMPMRMVLSFASSVFSAFVGMWFLASFAALGRNDR